MRCDVIPKQSNLSIPSIECDHLVVVVVVVVVNQ